MKKLIPGSSLSCELYCHWNSSSESELSIRQNLPSPRSLPSCADWPGPQSLGPGQVSYSAWVEMLPTPVQTVPLTAQPGDVIGVSVAQQNPGSWQISNNNQTTSLSYQTTVQYSSSLSSAEWIEEAPSTASVRARIVSLDDFGQVQFQDASAQLGGQTVTIAEAGAQPIAMYDRSGIIASPSAIGQDGSSFTVTRLTSGP
jgi:Peptidase A4 family